MSNLWKFEFSEVSFLGVVMLAVLLAVILKIANMAVLKKITNQRIKYYYPIFEVIIWFIFLLWGLNVLFRESFYQMIVISSLSAIFIVGLGWFVIRDLFAGVVLRMTDRFYPGQYLRVDQRNGRIKRVGMLNISLQEEDGSVSKIPWNKINGQIYSNGTAADTTNRQQFTVEIPQKYPLESVQRKIYETVLLSVGAAINKEPQIKLTGTANQEWQLEITAYALSPEYFRIIQANVKDVLNNFQN